MIKKSQPLATTILTTLLILFISVGVKAQFHIIPQPVKIIAKKGSFVLKNNATIGVDANTQSTGEYLQNYMQQYYGIHLNIKQKPGSGAIVLTSNTGFEKGAYDLAVNSSNITINGSNDGVFYGVQSLIQLLPSKGPSRLLVPGCEITDNPRFKWRGLSMDVSRHFFTVDEVKKYIDMMAHYKLNVFHWHLTDDEGWRIQIDKYPLLTEVGAKITAAEKAGKYRKLDNLIDGGGRDGFYTKNDIREVLKYAKERYITILPEIEMPGHSEAAIFAYPELGCKDSTGAVHRVRMLDPSEYTFNFYENVLSEVIDLFPNQYIHIGGDEAEMIDWLKSPTAVALMKREHFTDVGQVQSYFIKRIESFLISKNKKLIGWDEILKGGLAPSATVMSWEGEEGGIQAAKMHHDVVMTPLPQMYFDAPQADESTEPIGWNPPVTWQMVYNYEPQSNKLTPEEAKYILGAQANIWAEKISNMHHLEYMIYPRLLGVAELTWTPKAEKNIERFEKSMYAHYNLFNLWDLNARIPNAFGLEDVVTNKDSYSQTLTYPLTDAGIQYTLSKKLPDTTIAPKAFPVTLDSPLKDTLRVETYITRAQADQIRQTAFIKHVMLAASPENESRLHTGLSYLAYRTTYSNTPVLDTAKSFIVGELHKFEHIKPFPGQFNTWVKLNGYLKIEKDGDYKIISGFEYSPLIVLDKTVIINYNRNKYADPQAAVLHLQKGIYQVSGYYLADSTNSEQTFLELQTADGKPLETAEYLFH